MEFRLLTAEEVDARISTCAEWGVSLLLYKDARCDQNILDETVGPLNWQRHHTRDNANCIVAIWDENKKQWIEKEDTGTESFTEKEKGLASDSFKRACFNWGIGRELYTAPTMLVRAEDLKTLKEQNGKWTCKDYFKVAELEYEDGKIVFVKVLNMKTNKYIEFGQTTKAQEKQEPKQKPQAKTQGKPKKPQDGPTAEELEAQKQIENSKISDIKVKSLLNKCQADGVAVEKILKLYKVKKLCDLTELKFRNILDFWEEIKKVQ